MIKNRLKQIRHEMQIDTQTEMARLLGINKYQYHRYESQNIQPTLEIALRIAEKLNSPVEKIFYREPE